MLCILYNYNLNQTGSEYYSETSLIRTLLGPTLLNLLFVLKFQKDQSNRTLAIVKKFPCRQKTKTSPYHNTIFSHITRDSSESVSLT